jgi:hypothetical protein
LSAKGRKFSRGNAECKLEHTQDVGHLVLKVLGRNKGVEQFLAAFDHGMDFTCNACQN